MTAATVSAHARRGLLALALGIVLSACGALDTIPALEERAKSAWSEVQNQYQRRADLIPSLIETVKGYAAQEREILNQVTEARARVVQAPVNAATITDPQAFKIYREAQDQLSGVLSRLLVTIERYPDLKTSSGFLALRSQLEGVENRIAVARRDYGEVAATYNTAIRTFPGRWVAAIFHPEAKPIVPFTPPPASETPSQAKF